MKTRLAVAVMGALAQESRLEITRLLVRAGPDGLPAGQIGARLGVNSATLAFHLNCLAGAGLVARQRSGRSIVYRANFPMIRRLADFLLENCCQGMEFTESLEECESDPRRQE